jgi:hypothetical protein
MASQSLEQRVEALERMVEILKTLPDRVGRLDDRVGRLDGRVANLEVEVSQLRVETRSGFSAMRGSIDELRAQMLMLHEDVLARFALLDEHVGRKPAARRRAPKTDPTKNG